MQRYVQKLDSSTFRGEGIELIMLNSTGNVSNSERQLLSVILYIKHFSNKRQSWRTSPIISSIYTIFTVFNRGYLPKIGATESQLYLSTYSIKAVFNKSVTAYSLCSEQKFCHISHDLGYTRTVVVFTSFSALQIFIPVSALSIYCCM